MLLAAAFVLLALDPFAYRPPNGPASAGGRNAEDVTVRGEELHRFVPGEMGAISIVPPEPVLLISRTADQVYEDPRSGPHIVLAEDLEYAFESRPVQVTIEARGGGAFPASQFEANYMARAGSESGWKSFELTTDFAAYSFTHTVAERGDSEGYDFVGIRPVSSGKRRDIEIRSIRIRSTGPKPITPRS